MSGTVNHPVLGLSLLVLAIGGATSAQGQTRLPKPVIGTPTVVTAAAAPASLTASSDARAQVTLTWPAVAGADRYRLTRIENTGDPEVIIEELPASAFVFEGATCVAGSGQPNCIYLDMSRLSRGTKPVGTVSNPYGSSYPHNVISGKLYTYRAWALFPGPILSPPSPPATVQVR